ncbi:hypothetical protein HPB50_022412 [Hyalomma asiaticum]|uniref:Uncharacterized protein n=1 Tax=Hyalomma asiaticum TaxID=266040 RepID=A0ACB7S1Z6_HYAAI|nr:hypothetical protein HPB50_022412 [Hyalomma asiaticum]
MDKAAERRARRAAAARARRSDPAVRAREAEASRDSARRRREDPALRALTLLTSFIEIVRAPGHSEPAWNENAHDAALALVYRVRQSAERESSQADYGRGREDDTHFPLSYTVQPYLPHSPYTTMQGERSASRRARPYYMGLS